MQENACRMIAFKRSGSKVGGAFKQFGGQKKNISRGHRSICKAKREAVASDVITYSTKDGSGRLSVLVD